MKIAIFGSSGWAREVLDVCYAAGCEDFVFIDRWTGKEPVTQFPVVEETRVPSLCLKGYRFMIGIGDNRVRKKIRDRFPDLPYANIAHPTASFGFAQKEIFESAVGNVVMAGVRFTDNVAIGNFGCFNVNSAICHDTVIEDFVNVSLGANVAGNVFIGEGAYIGAGSTIVNGRAIDDKIHIGAYSTVGAGAVVVRNVPPGETVVGIPARCLRREKNA